MTKNPLELSVEISGEFGSPFQEETAREALKGMLIAFKHFYQNRHQKNKIDIWIDGVSLEKFMRYNSENISEYESELPTQNKKR